MRRERMLEMGLDEVTDKHSAYLVESGYRSITRRIESDRQRVAVVGRDGTVYELSDWPRSRTFRTGLQENLLVGDNRTRDWEQASMRLRRRLTRDSWGKDPDSVAQELPCSGLPSRSKGPTPQLERPV